MLASLLLTRDILIFVDEWRIVRQIYFPVSEFVEDKECYKLRIDEFQRLQFIFHYQSNTVRLFISILLIKSNNIKYLPNVQDPKFQLKCTPIFILLFIFLLYKCFQFHSFAIQLQAIIKIISQLMKTVEQLKEEIYQNALSSGYFKSMQAQLKTYVYDLIEKEYNSGRSKTGFQYEHPLLPKLRKYPLTSLCMDLIQQFLESFKFKHTLNVFKKQINRTQNVSRASLTEQFRIQIKNPQSQAVLLSLVSQMVSGQVGAIRQPIKINNFVQKKPQPPARNNYMMGQPQKPMQNTQTTNKSSTNQNLNNSNNSNQSFQPSKNQSSSLNNSNSVANQSKSVNNSMNQSSSKQQNSAVNAAPIVETSQNSNMTSEKSSQVKDGKQKKNEKDKKKKVQKQKPPEGATDLLGDVMKKFEGITKTNKQEEKKSLFESKRAFSEQKEKKVADPSQSGVNKIRGISAGKPMSSFMNKFMPQAAQPVKNESYIEQQMDQFQQSKDSTRRNPLFSSTQSGFDKSGFDYSVDSNSIEQYEYVERARKAMKKN